MFKKKLSIRLLLIIVVIALLMSSTFYVNKNFKHKTEQFYYGHDEIWEKILRLQRQEIREEMKSLSRYPYLSNLQNLTLETNGNPIRSLLISPWQKEATFLGEILNLVPSNYYHFEGFACDRNEEIRDADFKSEATKTMRKLFSCSYSYFFTKHLGIMRHAFPVTFFKHNKSLYSKCNDTIRICSDPRFIDKFCKLFPFQLMKILRISLDRVEGLMKYKKLNVRVVYLVRDPRSSKPIRKIKGWCSRGGDWGNPSKICNSMANDYKTALKMAKQYPKRFKIIRFEELIMNPIKVTKEIFKFYHLPYDNKVKKYLKVHMESKDENLSSESYYSTTSLTEWTKHYNYSTITKFQKTCNSALKVWRYRLIKSSRQLKSNFKPLMKFSLQIE